MKALSLLQPWASLIAKGAKRVETRSWPTDYRGWLAIHASARFPASCRDLCWEEPFRTYVSRPGDLPLGAIVAVVRLEQCVPVGSLGDYPLSEEEIAFGDYASGRYAWVLEPMMRVKPAISCKGSLGLWEVPAEVRDALAEQWRAAMAGLTECPTALPDSDSGASGSGAPQLPFPP